jgi:50S ribosomal protein L16 3-hydroxylase
MLEQWLAPTGVDAFVRDHLRRLPWASPGSGAATIPRFDWPTLGRVLAAEPPADVLVVGRGELFDVPAPRSVDQARALLGVGVGLVIRHSERQDDGLAGIAERFARVLPGEIHVQLFVTAAGTHGFGWHFDDEDVFIVQTAGIKDYYFRPNTVASGPAEAASFARFGRETSPLATARLLPGDFLYLPSRWWHMALCVEDSLSISLGALLAA